MAETAEAISRTGEAKGIQLTDSGIKEVLRLRERKGADLWLRVGVKGGGCSGLSYTMDFDSPNSVTEHDEVYSYEEGFSVIADKKSLLYLYGMVLDYSDDLLGGGFKFVNPNAQRSCSCGSSFST